MKTNSHASENQLVRSLGLVMATAVIVGTVIGSGVFKKPASIAHNVPYSGLVSLVWIIAGVLVLLGALAYAEVSVLLPQAGGNYVFLRDSYGRLAGFLWGWVDFLIIKAASLAALATIFAESFHDILRNPLTQSTFGLIDPNPLGVWGERLLTVVVLLGLAWINVRGTRWGGGLQVLITTVKVGSLLFLLILPFLAWMLVERFPTQPSTANLQPMWPTEWGMISRAGLGTAFLGVLWAYHGWMNLTPVAAEVLRPQRNLPLALLMGVGIIIFLYLGVNLSYYLVLTGPEMAQLGSTTVATAFSSRLLGPVGAVFASAAVMISVFGALNGLLLISPRLLFAMGEDGLAPAALRRVHPRYHTPDRAIWVMAVWAAMLVVSVGIVKQYTEWLAKVRAPFDVLTDFAMFGAVIFETMAVLAIFVLRRTMPLAPRPYRCWGYPIVPALYVLLPGFVLGNMFVEQQLEVIVGLVFIAAGVGCYFLMEWLGPQQSSINPRTDPHLNP
jgi:amino acid transporter